MNLSKFPKIWYNLFADRKRSDNYYFIFVAIFLTGNNTFLEEKVINANPTASMFFGNGNTRNM